VAKNTRRTWERAVRRIARAAIRPWPAAPVLSAIERAAPRYARLALRAHGAGLPRNVRAFPAKVAPYLGTEPGAAERARLVKARLVFLLVRSFVNQFLLVRGTAEERRGLGPIEVHGATYLEAALAERRGLMLISAHFGLPPLIGLALEQRGLPVVSVGGIMADRVDVVVGRDVWAAARSMQRVRDALADGQVCVLLIDTPRGRYMEPPFLQGRIPVAAGAFRLAQLTRSPLLPVFAVHTGARPRFRVEIGPPLPVPDGPSTSPFAEGLNGFIRSYEAIARRHPAQLFGYERVFRPRRLSEKRA
jgi:lauroyl/myristoyl acyltransferase